MNRGDWKGQGVTNREPDRLNDEQMDILLAREMTRLYGPLMSGEELRSALGISSKEAFRKALARKTLPVPVFPLENRRGKFALTLDVAKWLVARREIGMNASEPPDNGETP